MIEFWAIYSHMHSETAEVERGQSARARQSRVSIAHQPLSSTCWKCGASVRTDCTCCWADMGCCGLLSLLPAPHCRHYWGFLQRWAGEDARLVTPSSSTS